MEWVGRDAKRRVRQESAVPALGNRSGPRLMMTQSDFLVAYPNRRSRGEIQKDFSQKPPASQIHTTLHHLVHALLTPQNHTDHCPIQRLDFTITIPIPGDPATTVFARPSWPELPLHHFSALTHFARVEAT